MADDPAVAAEFARLALFAADAGTRRGLADAAARSGLPVSLLSSDPEAVAQLAQSLPNPSLPDSLLPDSGTTAWRAPGGLLAAAGRRGALIPLFGPTPEWFTRLDPGLTGRRWTLTDPSGARRQLVRGPALIKLADGKHPGFPARRHRGTDTLDRSIAAAGGSERLQLLVTPDWLPVASEYRTFTVGRTVLTCSPYRVEDDPWTPLLRTHRASFHDEAATWAGELLRALRVKDVPPAAVLDIARLDDGRFILLEANNAWGAGLYGCDPDLALASVLEANRPQEDRWRWRPDPAVP